MIGWSVFLQHECTVYAVGIPSVSVFLFTGVHEAEGLYCYSRYRTNIGNQ